MKYFKDANNQVFAYEADGSQDEYIQPNLTPITFEEAQALTAPPPLTLPEQFEAVRIALQSEIDRRARLLGFSSGDALMLYAGKDNPFRAVADPFFTWEAAVWFEAGVYRQGVIEGTNPMISPEQAVEMMPLLML